MERQIRDGFAATALEIPRVGAARRSGLVRSMGSRAGILGVHAYERQALTYEHMHRTRGYAAKMPKNKPLRVVLGENVGALMRQKNMNQVKVEAAARKAGFTINQTTVSRVMRAGKPNASREEASYPTTVDSVEAIANALGESPFRLLIPASFDEKLLAILQAWSVTSEVGRDLLRSAAVVAIEKYGRESVGERRS